MTGLWGGASGCGPASRQGFQGLVQGAGQRYPAVQPGKAEQLADLRLAADHVQAAAAGGSTLGRADQLAAQGAPLARQAARPTVTVPERQRVIYAFTGTVGQQASRPRLMSAAQLAASFRLDE